MSTTIREFVEQNKDEIRNLIQDRRLEEWVQDHIPYPEGGYDDPTIDEFLSEIDSSLQITFCSDRRERFIAVNVKGTHPDFELITKEVCNRLCIPYDSKCLTIQMFTRRLKEAIMDRCFSSVGYLPENFHNYGTSVEDPVRYWERNFPYTIFGRSDGWHGVRYDYEVFFKPDTKRIRQAISDTPILTLCEAVLETNAEVDSEEFTVDTVWDYLTDGASNIADALFPKGFPVVWAEDVRGYLYDLSEFVKSNISYYQSSDLTEQTFATVTVQDLTDHGLQELLYSNESELRDVWLATLLEKFGHSGASSYIEKSIRKIDIESLYEIIKEVL